MTEVDDKQNNDNPSPSQLPSTPDDDFIGTFQGGSKPKSLTTVIDEAHTYSYIKDIDDNDADENSDPTSPTQPHIFTDLENNPFQSILTPAILLTPRIPPEDRVLTKKLAPLNTSQNASALGILNQF